MKKIKHITVTEECQNCFEETTGIVYCDVMGPHMLCSHCGSSFNVTVEHPGFPPEIQEYVGILFQTNELNNQIRTIYFFRKLSMDDHLEGLNDTRKQISDCMNELTVKLDDIRKVLKKQYPERSLPRENDLPNYIPDEVWKENRIQVTYNEEKRKYEYVIL